MTQKNFNVIVGTVFLIVAVAHLLRVFYGWSANVSTFEIPMWWSWVGVLLAGYLSYSGLKSKG
ncbi:MAG: hypothetical protein CO185_01130 [Candidatus Zambryskibacteria bacterium CG_4_9_14_3_um_filter_42_15]|uniref:Uncharacterized protein n=1 Tax=Candidatus Zambryskibacteria bacterium CG_4_9_14_3_um_filter_42_15 TaxID=1975112 RepID=A0A2M7WSF4_9BACT|nr:MAG: hypothetical protein CO185_01130 [Candidatus Zambryskibacteria bacterium CG_4_9_14_3_um_filter_42_15]